MKDVVRVVFMTSSASRGLSFPHARHILVAIPGFAVEQNLMETFQIIYRGRGGATEEAQPRTLIFYLAEEVVYEYESYRARAVQEQVLSLVTLLVVLKLSILTRIRGYGLLGTERVLMVPVGGKSKGERELILRLHATKEDIPSGGVVIDATQPLGSIVDEILSHVQDT